MQRRTTAFAQARAACLLLPVLLAACSGKDNGSAKDKPAPPPSPFAAIANGKIDVEGGIIEVAARRGGVIRDVYVQEGAVVRKGQVLARQEDDDALLAVASARAAVAQAQSQAALLDVNLATAQRELERLQRLEPSNLVARQQVDQASDALAVARAQRVAQQAAVATTEAQLAQARYSADLTIIRAPMNGKIIRRYANPGAGASTLQVSKMFDLEPDAARIVRAEITESSIPSVRVGQEAEIVPEADETIVQAGKVIRMAATFGARKLSSDAAGEAADERVVEVVVSADKAPFLIGQRVLVKFMKPGERAGAQREPAARKP